MTGVSITLTDCARAVPALSVATLRRKRHRLDNHSGRWSTPEGSSRAEGLLALAGIVFSSDDMKGLLVTVRKLKIGTSNQGRSHWPRPVQELELNRESSCRRQAACALQR